MNVKSDSAREQDMTSQPCDQTAIVKRTIELIARGIRPLDARHQAIQELRIAR